MLTLIAIQSNNRDYIVFIPILSIPFTYIFLEDVVKYNIWFALIPQAISYISLIWWLLFNKRDIPQQVWIRKRGMRLSFLYGLLTGSITGIINLFIILKVTPWLGHSYDFLRETPHARVPFWIMMPWGILLIATLVEINFRGFIFRRLIEIFKGYKGGISLGVFISALAFSYDPFMYVVFKGFHWLALSDGVIWGYLFYRTGNIISTITAHSVEVMIVYGVLKVFYV